MTSTYRGALLATLLLITALTACTSAKKTPPEQVAAQAFLDALGSGNPALASGRTTDARAAAASIALSLVGLGSGATGSLLVSGLSARTKTSATAAYTATWSLPSTTAKWSYTDTLPLVKSGSQWLVTWSPATLFPTLPAGDHLQRERTQPTRADLQDSTGAALFAQTAVVDVGIEPALVTNLATLAITLASVLKISAADILTSVKAAQPHDFVPVITLRRPAYEAVRSQIHDLPGTVFRDDTLLLPPSTGFAQPLLGSVGAATKEIIDGSPGRVEAGDQTGLSGLQRAYDPQLSGTAGLDIYAAKDNYGTLGAKLATVAAPKPGQPVRLTLDRTAQQAADAALAAIAQPAAIVALQPSTGKILAVADSTAATSDIALDGEFPAGSTFKIVTYTALFTARPALTPATTADCPSTTDVNGRIFENENQFSEGTIPISSAFAYSCNTTAINFGVSLPGGALASAAAGLGLGATWTLPVDAFSGSIPASATGTELAAEAIGQGKVLVSPLVMASIAGAAASGRLVEPSLAADAPGVATGPYPAALTAKLNTLLLATVAEPFGTAHALADLPGEVRGKTGTAEFGTDVPPKSHAWMVGSRGDLAFSVFVYGGESSATAVPIAHAFLSATPS